MAVVVAESGSAGFVVARRALAAALLATTLLAVPLSPAHAANVVPQLSGAALERAEADRKNLFARMLADPGNVPLAISYARLSASVGDLEGAISTLERLLIFAPAVAALNFELGTLYLQLGAYAQASANFTAAANAPDATPQLKAQALALVARADQQATGDYLVGSIATGIRYQTNANSGVATNTVDLNGVPFTVSASGKADDDVNAFATLFVKSSKDLANQGDRWDSQLSVYLSKYLDHTELDTASGEVQTGPSLNLARIGLRETTLGVYGIAAAMTLEGTPYLYTLGAGALVTLTPAPQTTIKSRLEYRYESFQDSVGKPHNSDMSGARIRLTNEASQQVSDAVTLYASLYGERNNGAVGYQSDWEAGFTAGTRIALPANDKGQRWVVDVSAALSGRQFDEADLVYSTDPRQDVVGTVRGVVTAPLGGGWAAIGTASYQKQLSTYDLFSFENIATSLALSKGF